MVMWELRGHNGIQTVNGRGGKVSPNLPDGVRMATPWYPLTTDDRNTAGFFLGRNGSYQPTTVVLCKVGITHHSSTSG